MNCLAANHAHFLCARDSPGLKGLGCHWHGLGHPIKLPVSTHAACSRQKKDDKLVLRKTAAVPAAKCPRMLFATVQAGQDAVSEAALGRLEKGLQACKPDIIFVDLLLKSIKPKHVQSVLKDLKGDNSLLSVSSFTPSSK